MAFEFQVNNEWTQMNHYLLNYLREKALNKLIFLVESCEDFEDHKFEDGIKMEFCEDVEHTILTIS